MKEVLRKVSLRLSSRPHNPASPSPTPTPALACRTRLRTRLRLFLLPAASTSRVLEQYWGRKLTHECRFTPLPAQSIPGSLFGALCELSEFRPWSRQRSLFSVWNLPETTGECAAYTAGVPSVLPAAEEQIQPFGNRGSLVVRTARRQTWSSTPCAASYFYRLGTIQN